jgi:hypothetical protein
MNRAVTMILCGTKLHSTEALNNLLEHTMKQFLPILLIFVLVAGLAGCSQNSTTTTTISSTAVQNQDDTALSLVTRLAIGTLNLENTDQAVTPEQAGEMLTLWQAYSSLSNSDTVTQTELDALVKQIQDALTTDQLKSIEDMQITRQSMNEIIQSLGLLPTMPVDANGTPMALGTPVPGQAFPEGGFPGGIPPGDFPTDRGGGFAGRNPGDIPPDGGGVGGIFGDGNGVGPGTQITPNATQQARRSSQATRANPMVLNALLTLLETRSQK